VYHRQHVALLIPPQSQELAMRPAPKI
jgi:hypothetical protein